MRKIRGILWKKSLTIMNTEIKPNPAPTREVLREFFNQVCEQFPGEYQCKVSICLEREIGNREEGIYWGHRVNVDNNLYHGKTLEEAFENAKKEFKLPDPKRKAAADLLREKANRIESGDEPIE